MFSGFEGGCRFGCSGFGGGGFGVFWVLGLLVWVFSGFGVASLSVFWVWGSGN